ncbi:MAG: hypothetical protein V3T77_00155, partial [Planctomycetota bacterium]
MPNELAQQRREELENLTQRYDDLPAEAILKEDLLRTGMAFTEEALRYAAEYKRKSYFIFSFDMVPIDAMQHTENLRAPEEIRFSGGGNHYAS